jgi:hypothetical protein
VYLQVAKIDSKKMRKIGNINALSKVDYNNGQFRTALRVKALPCPLIFSKKIAKSGDIAVRDLPLFMSSNKDN